MYVIPSELSDNRHDSVWLAQWLEVVVAVVCLSSRCQHAGSPATAAQSREATVAT